MKTLSRLLALVALVIPVAATYAATAPAGHWEGAINLPGTKLEIRVDLSSAADTGVWSGTIDIPAQMLRGFKLAAVSVDGAHVSFKLPDIPGDPVFDGTIVGDGVRFTGTLSQSGQTFPFALERRASTARAGETPSQGVPGEGLVGHWQGSLRTGPVELRLVLHVAAGEAGALTATIDSIDQGAKGIPVSLVTLTDGVAHLELARIKATYEGKLSANGAELAGNWKQGPLDAPLVFRRLAAAPELSRPQEPKKPYPYEERTVSFTGGASDVTLAGTLTLPSGAGPFPAVVLLSGSGPQNRDEALLGHRPFLVLADHLTRQGIAVLRFDDRGIAGSTGNFGTATHEDFAADALAAFNYLKTQPGIDAAQVGLCGHSEGGVHATLVAAQEGDIAFVVMLAGVGVPIDQLLERQRADIMRASGADFITTPEEKALGDKIFIVLRARGATDEARTEVRAILNQIAARYTPEQRAAIGFSDGLIDQQVAMMTSPWFVTLLAYDPAPMLARVRCPVLALNGEKDLQVAFQENLDGIRQGLAAGANHDVTTQALPDLNHLFQRCQTGAISEYATIEETMNPEVLTRVSEWIRRHTDS